MVFLIASDANPIAFNPMPAGTVVSVVGTKGLTSSVDGGSPVPSTVSPTGVAIGYGFDDTTDSGTITVTFTTPGKLSTAFSQFITGTTATASQIEFIDLIVQELTENGVMEPARLYEPPFIDINDKGPEAIFLPAKVTEMVRVLEEIRERAVG